MYLFEIECDDDWMGCYFFIGGLMLVVDIFMYFQQYMVIEQQWCLFGMYYEKIVNYWLVNQDVCCEEIFKVLVSIYGM